MKKTVSALLRVLFVLNLFYPAGTIICYVFGLKLELFSISSFAAASAVLSVITVAFDLRCKAEFTNRTMNVISVLIAPVAVINTIFYLYECVRLHIILLGFVSIGCGFLFALKHGKPFVPKIVSLVLTGIFTSIMLAISPLILIFGNFGANTVEQVLESPDGKYYAEVINSDGGALGGDTLVDVHKKGSINLLLFKISNRTQRVYVGDWGEFYDMEIYWKNEKCLVINSAEYEIK